MKTRDALGPPAVVPVMTVDDAARAAPLGAALWRGGLRVVEITLRTPAALGAIAAMKRELPELRVGAGTIATEDDAERAIAAGADFLVTPGTTPRLGEALARLGAPCLPGAATASEAMTLSELGFDALKFFPAEPLGGPDVLRALHGPLPHLVFCPTGGIGEDRVERWLALPNVGWVGGSWVAPDALVRAGDWAAIEANARRAAALAR